MSFLFDIVRAGRRLRRSAGNTVLGMLILGLALGSTTALIAVVRASLLEPLPYGRPNELVGLWEVNRPRSRDHNIVSPANYLDWRDRTSVFSDMALYTWSGTALVGDGVPERLSGRAVTPNTFDLLAVRPILGRAFVSADADSGAVATMLLSYGLWQRRFGGKADVVGKMVTTESGSAQIIGVMPQNFLPLGTEEYWEPFRLTESMRIRRGRYAMGLARLKPGKTVEDARTELTPIAAALETEHPDFNAGWGVQVVPLRDDVVGSVERPLMLLLGAVGLVLLIAASNLGNLLLVQADARRRDFAVQRAMGASRSRVVFGWVMEAILLALGGAGAGAVLAFWAVELAPRFATQVPRIANAHIDGMLLGGLLLTAVSMGSLLGLVSVIGSLKGDPGTTLRSASDRIQGGLATRRFRAALVAGQFALAVVLLHGAGLLLRSLSRLEDVRPGFDPQGVLTAELSLPGGRYEGDARQLQFFDQLLTRLRQDRQVTSAGAINFLPFTGPGAATSIHLTDRPEPPPGQAPVAAIRIADPDYFKTMDIPLMAGRGFTPADRAEAPPVVLISQQMAREQWPSTSAIGQRIKVEYGEPDKEVEIVGVVGDVLQESLDGKSRGTIYYPVSQLVTSGLTIVVRTSGDPAALSSLITSAVRELDPLLPVESMQPLASRLGDSLAPRRSSLLLLGSFAAIAVILAAVGIYGVLSQVVRLRTREIGIRLALGSSPSRELSSVLRGSLRLVGVGAVVGMIGAAIASLSLKAFLFAVPAGDPLTIAAVLFGLVGIAVIASLLPARRAAGVDPAVALRSE